MHRVLSIILQSHGLFLLILHGSQISYGYGGNSPVYAAMAALILIAGLWAPFGGSHWAFLQIARYFDFDRARMLKDGAKLAAMVASSAALNLNSQCHWIMRPQKDSRFFSDADAVDRSHWVLGHIVCKASSAAALDVPRGGGVLLRVFYAQDRYAEWSARYKGVNLVFSARQGSDTAGTFFAQRHGTSSSSSGGASTCAVADFSAWRDAIFSSTILLDSNEGNRNESVLVWVSSGASSQNVDADWAISNLRRYPWPGSEGFKGHLLATSPRDVAACSSTPPCKAEACTCCSKGKGDNACSPDKCGLARLYQTSEKCQPGDRIDYFLSHAWADPPAAKLAALRAFMARTGGGSLWFDKVCINKCVQADAERAIAALPVNVSACSKVLVLLGPNYLRRIWCVWELQSVFTFCIKELAVERIALVVVDDDDEDGSRSSSSSSAPFEVTPETFSKWTLDSAHCFDPNEEFKLRQLVHDIGEERFTESVRNLGACEIFRPAASH